MDLDFVSIVLDEISLEGLEGITLSSLWVRLSDVNFPLDSKDLGVQRFVWSNIILDKAAKDDLNLFCLPEPRKTVKLYDRYQHVNPDTGACLETDSVPEDVYGIVTPISDGTIRGSCNSYEKRVDITRHVLESNCDLDKVHDKYENRLVIVASQRLRECALRLPHCDPCLPLTPMQYCVLEKIGRARRYGEVTVGKEASRYREQPKTLFYYRKILLCRGLIKKQQHIISIKQSGQNRIGLVLTLPRFHFVRLMPLAIAAMKVSQFLQNHPGQDCDYYEVQNGVGVKKKLFRTMFPNYLKNFSVYQCNDPEKENEIKRRIKLLKPVSFESESEDEGEDDLDENENENELIGNSSKKVRNFSLYSMTFNPKQIVVDRSLANQVLELIDKWESPSGISLREIGEEMRLPKLVVRQIARVLERLNEVTTVMTDHGRQKIFKYKPINRKDSSRKIFEEEKLLKLSTNETLTFTKRANLILEAVKKNKIYDELVSLRKLISAAEKDSPYTVDRTSIKTIIQKLALKGYVRYIRTLLTYQGKEYKFEIVCDPSITANSSLVRDKIETKKFRLFGAIGDDNLPRKIVRRKPINTNETSNGSQDFECELKYKPSVARRYGYEPKMKKLLTLFKFIFHVMCVTEKRMFRDWRQNISKLILASDGSCTLGDLIPRIPLSVFVKIVFISYEVPELEDYLNDQSRRNLTMQMLPPSLRKKLMLRRKYIFNIFEELVSLQHMNLVKLEYHDQCLKETAKIFLSTTANFWDFQQVREYEFKSMEDIEKYEHDLLLHCSRQDCNNCSMDPRLFAHNHRNWTYAPHIKVAGASGFAIFDDPPRQRAKRKRTKDKVNKSDETLSASKKSCLAGPAVGGQLRKSSPRANTDERNSKLKPGEKKKRRTVLDEIDGFALKKRKKLRVNWTKEEDCFLLMCRIASILLDPSCPTFVCVPGSVIRDELHKYLPEASTDKTIKACQRRLNYMLKSARTRENVLEWVADVKQEIESLNLGKPNSPKNDTKAWSDAFLKYLHILLTKFQAYHLSLSSTSITAPAKQYDSLDELLKNHKIIETETDIMPFKPPLFQEPQNIVDICVSVVLNVIVSTLLQNHFEKSDEQPYHYSHTLFKIYQKYPDTLIRSVVTRLTKNRIMTKKRDINSLVNFRKSRGLAPYKIAQAFLFSLKTKYGLFDLTVDAKSGPIELRNPMDRGSLALAISLFCARKVKFSVKIPENMVVLDKSKVIRGLNSDTVSQVELGRNLDDTKFASRFILHCYRERMVDKEVTNSQHAQDYLLLKTCSVLCQGVIDDFDFVSFEEALKAEESTKPWRRPEVKSPRLKQLVGHIKKFNDLGALRQDLIEFSDEEISRLLEMKVIFEVGVNQRHFVHYDSIDHWLVHSQSVENGNLIKDVHFVPKFWKNAYGCVNKRLFFQCISFLLANLWLKPCVNLESLTKSLDNVLPPKQVCDLLKFLERLRCVQTLKIPKIKEVHLFDDNDEHSEELEDYYLASPGSFAILCQVKSHFGC